MLLIGEISCIKRFKVGDWVIEADVEETRKQYEKDIEDMGECGNCLNFSERTAILKRLKF
ncbi:hypothetical protein D068_cds39780 [Bacillus atrophaeus UCMB-5137]|uniref:hypothetical protein n=1 Tax=Bacillus atrophaeus TaxID=1452 RepID=UPI00033043E2|nr:hypothetical protein [Bacillus atrophaeus]AKL86765.1 hypothetical protein D068_cds39780 [Bacillus atrophaeus UCMB-5137]